MTSLAARRSAHARRLAATCAGALLLLAVGQPSAQSAPGPELVYSAQRGDTLIGIGARLLARPADWREVARLNRIRDPDLILPAQPIRIPLRLLRGQSAPAEVLAAVGDARVAGAATPLAAGATLPEGTRVVTGSDGYLTLRLVDGSVLRLQAASEAALAQSRLLGTREPASTAGHRLQVELLRGRVEALVNQVTGGAPRFEIRTPHAMVGVRGTEFRVAADEALTRSEVLSGRVAVGRSSSDADGQPVEAGFGARSDGRRVTPPAPLLPAPALDGLPARVERVLVRMPLAPVAGAARYRVQVARDDGFREVAAEGLFDSPELRFATLDDGDWRLRVRAIDADGMEGRDALHLFTLKARPEPPAVLAPPPGARLPAARLELRWAAHPQARHYRVQLARSADFARVERSVDANADTVLVLDDLQAGAWHWRLATVRSVMRDGRRTDDAGPWGDAQMFELRALPPLPAAPRIDAGSVLVAWGGEPGQHFDFQLARDAGFTALLIERRLDAPELRFARPPPGRYFLRYRAIDPDGYVGPFIAAQALTLADCIVDGSGGCVASGGDVLRRP